MSIYKSFLKNNLVLLLGHLALYAKGIVLLPLLIKTVGVKVYGTYALITSFIGIVFGISSFGVGFKYQRFMPSAAGVEEKRNLFFPQFYFHGLSVAILAILVFLFGDTANALFFKNSADYSWLLVGGILPATFLYSQATDYFRYTHRMGHFSAATAANPYLFILFTALGVLLLPKVGMNYLLLAMLASVCLASAPMLWKMFREIGMKMPELRLPEITSDMKLGIPILLSYVIDFVISGSDRFVIAYYMSAKEVGYYNPAYTLGALVIMFPKIMGVALPPLLSKAVDGNDEESARGLLGNAVKFYLLLVIPFIVGSVFLSHRLLVLLANREVADSAFLVTPVISLGILFYGLNIILSFGVAFVKLKTELIFYSNVIAGVLSLSLNLIVMYFVRSIVVAGVTSLVSFLVAFLFLNRSAGRLIDIEYDTRCILKVILASALMGVFLFLQTGIMHCATKSLLLLIPVDIAVYLGFCRAFRVFGKEDLDLFRGDHQPVVAK